MSTGKKENNSKIDIRIPFTNHNARYSVIFSKIAEIILGGKETRNTESAKKKLKEALGHIRPYDPTIELEGVSAEARELFSKKKFEIFDQMKALIVDEIFSDLDKGVESPDFQTKEATLTLDLKDIQTQKKYLKLVFEKIERQIIEKISGELHQASNDTVSNEAKEEIEFTISRIEDLIKKNFEADWKGMQGIIDERTGKLFEELKREKGGHDFENTVLSTISLTPIEVGIEKVEKTLNIKGIDPNTANAAETAISELSGLKRTCGGKGQNEEAEIKVGGIISEMIAQIKTRGDDNYFEILQLLRRSTEVEMASEVIKRLKTIDISGLSEGAKEKVKETLGGLELSTIIKSNVEKEGLGAIVAAGTTSMLKNTSAESAEGQKNLKKFADRAKNIVENYITRNHIDKSMRQVKKEMREIDLENLTFEQVNGMANLADQFSKVSAMLDDKNVKISTNFFNKPTNLMLNASIFTVGWALEQSTKFLLELTEKMEQAANEAISVDPNDWDRVMHFLGILTFYMHDKKKNITKQITPYEKSSEEAFEIDGEAVDKNDIIRRMKDSVDLIDEMEPKMQAMIIKTFLDTPNEFNERVAKNIREYDLSLHSDPKFKGLEKIFKRGGDKTEKEEKKRSPADIATINHLRTYEEMAELILSESIEAKKDPEKYKKARAKKLEKMEAKMGGKIEKAKEELEAAPEDEKEKLEKKISNLIRKRESYREWIDKSEEYEEHAVRLYEKNKKYPIMDTIIPKDGKISQVHEIKSLQVSTAGEDGVRRVKLPFYLSPSIIKDREQTVMNKMFEKRGRKKLYRENNIEEILPHAEEIMWKTINRLNKYQYIGVQEEDIFYIFNFIDEENNTNYLCKVPLEAFKNMLLSYEGFFRETIFVEKEGYKWGMEINFEHVKEEFREYIISNKAEHNAKKTSIKQP